LGALPSNDFLLAPTDPEALTPGVTAALNEVNPDITSQSRALLFRWAALGRERLLATLFGFFGAVASALPVIGFYGVMSHNVARRRNETAFAWYWAKWRFWLWRASRVDWPARCPANLDPLTALREE
jgi:hypothetical protein